MTKHKCKNPVPTPTQQTSLKRTRNTHTHVPSNGPVPRKPRIEPEPPTEYETTPNATPSKKRQHRKRNKSNMGIVSPSITTTPHSTPSTHPLPGLGDDNNLSEATPECLAANYAQSQASSLRQQLATSPDLEFYSTYVEPMLHAVVCLSCSKTVHLDHVRSHLISDRNKRGVRK